MRNAEQDGHHDKRGVIASILAWVIPLFALIGNMHFSHFDVRILDKSEGESLLDMTIRHLINGGRSLLFNYVSVILHVLGDRTPPPKRASGRLEAFRSHMLCVR